MIPNSPNQEMPSWIPRATFTVIACILSVVAGFWLVQKLSALLAWFITALFLSFAIEPLTNKLQKRGWKRGRATALIIVSLFIVLSIFVGSMVPLVISQVQDLISDAPRFVNQINDFTTARFGIELSTGQLISKLTELGGSIGVEGDDVASNVIGVGGRLAGGMFQIFTVALFTYYLVVDGPAIRRKTMAIMPARQQKIFLETWEVAIEKMGGYLYVRLILAGLATVTAFIVMSIAGVPFALPLAIWIGLISQFIPVVGTYIAAAVPLLVAVLENPWSALALLIYVLLYQQIENYILSPKLTEKTMQLHPAIAIGAAIAGASLYGPIGAFLALPAAAILQVVAASYIKRHEVIDDDGDLLGIKPLKAKRRTNTIKQ
jgi:predicted PurR-regulated permease PerM